MAEPTDTPIVVNPNPWPAQIASAARVLIILLGGLSALLGFVKTRDIAGLVEYLRSADFVPVLGAAGALAAFLYGQIKVRLDKRKAVTMAVQLPNEIAVVKTKGG